MDGLVLWYQGDRLVEKDDQRVKIDIKEANHTTGNGGEQQGHTTSTLTVARAAPRDSGNYSCWPSAGRPDSVLLHVIHVPLNDSIIRAGLTGRQYM
ncbi:hypothetical protein Pcinc_042402 [Petrolisthes cinctipes]|uniref:Ig-like domain-containing protein n=1 Tax=Petrolisthes cinctipes TaxID=88211 RepID=A0AAE1EG12_PETCI|nr:hypothetical protein Pcinc_042402 [Petrolisthes cinctipes]